MSANFPTGRVLTGRDRAILAAVAAGRVEMSCSCEPDLFVDGLCCCDQVAARNLARAGFIAAKAAVRLGSRVAAVLTPAGAAMLAGHQQLAA
ncbi:MAG: hypothetical protein ACRDQW_06065 [Haloechinothrix sp.]